MIQYIRVRDLAEYFYNQNYHKPNSYNNMKRKILNAGIRVRNARIDAEDISKLLKVML